MFLFFLIVNILVVFEGLGKLYFWSVKKLNLREIIVKI